MSKKKEDLESILNHFNIQVDNPVVIMSQDTSRCFLPSTSSSEKYKVSLKYILELFRSLGITLCMQLIVIMSEFSFMYDIVDEIVN